MSVQPVPEGYHTLIPYLAVDDAANAIEYYKKAFGAKERARMDGPDGKIGHAELEIGDSMIMLADEFPDMGATKSPKTVGGTPVTIMVYVEDVDAVYQKALDNGASAINKVEDQFYGDRSGMVACPFGYRWFLAVPKEVVSPQEMQKRWNKMLEGGKVE